MSFIYKYKTSTPKYNHAPYLIKQYKTYFTKPILCTISLTWNPEVVLLIGSAKKYNNKHKTCKNITKKCLPTICLMVYLESTITCNPGLTNFLTRHLNLVKFLDQTYRTGIRRAKCHRWARGSPARRALPPACDVSSRRHRRRRASRCLFPD